MKRLILVAIVAMLAAALTAPATATASVNCTVGTVNFNDFFVVPNPGYWFVGESNEQATCTGGAWYETTQILVQNKDGNWVDEHCGNQNSICYRLRPSTGSFAAGQTKWCTVTNFRSDPSNNYGADCAFQSVHQDPCSLPMQLLITVWDASTLLPVDVRQSANLC